MNVYLKKLFKVLPYILLGGLYAFNIWYIVRYGKASINSDMSAEMMLAKLMNEDNDFLLCSNWSYSTEIRVVYMQPIYRLGLLLIPNNWFYVRIFGNCVMLLLLIISFLHLCKTLEIEDIGPWLAIILICPLSYQYFKQVGISNAYIPHMISYIVLSDLFLLNKKKNSKLIVALAVLLGFICGLNGIRIIYNYLVPLVSTIVIKELCFNKKSVSWGGQINQLTKKYASEIITAVFICLGFLINNFYLKANYSFTNYFKDTFSSISLGSLYTAIAYLPFLLGFSSTLDIISGNYICLLSLPLIITLFAGFIWSLKKLRNTHENDDKYLYILIGVPVSIIELALVFFLTSQLNQRYWIPTVPFLLIYIGIYLKQINKKQLMAIITACMLVLSWDAYKSYVKNYTEEAREETVNYIMNSGYSQGCASFWNADLFIELSNGQLDIWNGGGVFDNDAPYSVDSWLQDIRHIQSEPTGKSFLIINTNTDSIDTSSIEEYLGFSKGTFKVYLFDDYQIIKDFINNKKITNE